MNEKCIKCIFIGCHFENKDYTLYDLVSKKLIISRDVIYDKREDYTPNEKAKNIEIDLNKSNLLVNDAGEEDSHFIFHVPDES